MKKYEFTGEIKTVDLWSRVATLHRIRGVIFMSCNNCIHKNKCLERSRDYPCISYRRKDDNGKWQQKRTLKTVSKNI